MSKPRDRRFGGSYDDMYPRSTPITVRGGIKAQNARGAFGTQWWAKQWLAVLESLQLGSRLQRGRAYARLGQVVALEIVSGRVSATIQGSRPQPYRATLSVSELDAETWQRALDVIAADTRFAAKLVAGEMPSDIEQAFAAVGASLFPRTARDLRTACSCPDASNPCKHIAAVYYLLGEQFDRDPFLLFTLRGRTKDDVLRALDEHGAADTAHDRSAPDVLVTSPDAIDGDLTRFWIGRSAEPDGARTPSQPSRAAGRRSVPSLPFWRGDAPLSEMLGRIDDMVAADLQSYDVVDEAE